MPTYQYACTDPECGDRFELVQSFTDPAASECPVCGGPVRKVFSAVGVVFKGSGFYRNDSRSGSSSKDGSSSSKPSSSEKSSESSGAKPSDTSAKTDSTKTQSSTKSGESSTKASSSTSSAAST